MPWVGTCFAVQPAITSRHPSQVRGSPLAESNRPKPNSSRRTLEITPNPGEMVKPSELIEIKGAAGLSLADRRVFNILLHNAFGPELGNEGRRFEIPLHALRNAHDSNDRLVASIEALMRTVVVISRPDGSTDRVQLLGWNNMADPRRSHGTLKYAIPPELSLLLRDSTVFAKLELEVLRAFTSKYALALYEAVARRARLKHVFTERIALADFRELLGVEPDKLMSYGNLNHVALKPALLEVNALSEFAVSVLPEKLGPRVVAVRMGWSMKGTDGQKAAWAELQRPKVGRRARITGTVETWAPDEPSAVLGDAE